MSQLNLTPVARVTLLDESISGLREIDSLGSILAVRAAPFSELDRMGLDSSNFIAYVIAAAQIYVGHGRGSRKIGDRLGQEKLTSQVYIIYSLDPRFDKLAAMYLEGRLIDTADELGLPLANITRPFGRNGLRPSADLEQLVHHAQFLLSVAEFQRFEEARRIQSDRPLRVAATGNLQDLRMIEPEAMTVPADAVLKRLICRADLEAEGYAVGNRFHVLPGADYSYVSRRGLSEDNRSRRAAIVATGVLQTLEDFADRARLPFGLDCKSPAIAAKVLSGEHLNNSAWQAIPSLQGGGPS